MKYSITGLIVGFSLLAGCQKTDVVPEGSAARVGQTAVGAQCVADNIGFEGASGLLTSVSSEGGTVVGITSNNPNYPAQPEAAIVFNTNPVSSAEDDDLGTPSNVFPAGAGVGAGGQSGPYVNDTPLGNILVVHNFAYPLSEPNDDDFNATDPLVGEITFDFSAGSPVTATSITVIDVETATEAEIGSVRLYSAPGGTLLGTYNFPDTGANGVAVVSLGNTPGVGYLVVSLGGSIGIDNLRFCRSTPPSTQCTRTLGYWKTHPTAWPVSSLTLGTVSYTQAQLLEILRLPVRGNGLISLAHQLIAAKLNVANGTSASPISATIAAADALIGSLNPLAGGALAPSATSSISTRLDNYNNGRLGPQHCE